MTGGALLWEDNLFLYVLVDLIFAIHLLICSGEAEENSWDAEEQQSICLSRELQREGRGVAEWRPCRWGFFPQLLLQKLLFFVAVFAMFLIKKKKKSIVTLPSFFVVVDRKHFSLHLVPSELVVTKNSWVLGVYGSVVTQKSTVQSKCPHVCNEVISGNQRSVALKRKREQCK